jgi:hypothetical protein
MPTSVLPSTVDRVPRHTAAHVNARIQQRLSEHVQRYGTEGRAGIERRLKELDREWDIERTLEANASAIALVGLLLGTTVHRRWFALPAVVAGFLMQHALQGWCPPVPVFRRLGVRTAPEIEQERYALKALRGDFQRAISDPEEAVRSVRE